MVANQKSNYALRGPSVGGSARFAQPQQDNGPRPEPKESGQRPWVLLHSYRIGDTYSDITSVMAVPGGCLIRTASKSAKGQSQAMVFVPGAKLADFAPQGGRATR
jgi:hypothetical protein